jgi:hypothetical protein
MEETKREAQATGSDSDPSTEVVKRGGSKKPLSRQWSHGGGKFTCGLCSKQFLLRRLLDAHKKACYSDFARVHSLIRESQAKLGPRSTPEVPRR